MELTQAQRDQVEAWVDDKSISRDCPVCGHPYIRIGGVVAGGEVVPTVQVICRTCGFVRLFSTDTIGITPREA